MDFPDVWRFCASLCPRYYRRGDEKGPTLGRFIGHDDLRTVLAYQCFRGFVPRGAAVGVYNAPYPACLKRRDCTVGWQYDRCFYAGGTMTGGSMAGGSMPSGNIEGGSIGGDIGSAIGFDVSVVGQRFDGCRCGLIDP